MQQTKRSSAGFTLEMILLIGLLVGGWWYYTTHLAPKPQRTTTAPIIGIPTSQHAITGGPSLSAGQVDTILSRAGSPAAGTGQTFYEQSLQTGINDAYALGFFQHESNMGLKGWAVVNKSIGNIRCTAGYDCNGGYRAYGSWADGVTDWFNLIKNLYIDTWHLATVEAIIPRYAPTSDHNDEQGYINSVVATVANYGGR
jgi:hypothetical protein